MMARALETDYLVIGSGAAGMAFTDTLIAESDAQVVMIDRRASPGGHWNDAYPFVRLHQPSMYYGVNSLPLGHDAIETAEPSRCAAA
jgi:cation diffusion facilitator CzcD-associated flavoprotein CzcO